MNVLQLAIGLEEKLEAYYLEQAEAAENTGLSKVFRLLAREERKHAELLMKHETKIADLVLSNSDVLAEAKELFLEMLPVKNEIKSSVNQLDVYRFAQEKEQESMIAYEKLNNEATGDEEVEIFTFLLNEERKHYNILEELILFVSKPEEWVEDAEFGLRKEY